MLPLLAQAQTKTKVLVITPQSVALNRASVRAMVSNGIKPDSLVNVARQTFVKGAKTMLPDYTVHVLGVDDSISYKPTPVERSTTIKVKRRNFITKKERFANKRVKYKGVAIGPDDKLKLELANQTFKYDYVVVITMFEIGEAKSLNPALKPLSRFAVHYEVYDKNLAFKTGNLIADDLVVSPSMLPSVMFHYINLSAKNAYLAVSGIIGQ